VRQQARARDIAKRRNELTELASLRVISPNLVFDQELSIDLGDRTVVLHDWGRANSPHDVTVYLPQENVIFTGDIVVQAPLPYVTESFPMPWISVLRRLESHPYAAIVPGHGPVMPDATYLRQLRTLFETVSARMAQLAAEGLTLDEARARIDPEEVRKDMPAWQGETLREDWKQTIDLLAERAWRGVRGMGS
jgi:cyclase